MKKRTVNQILVQIEKNNTKASNAKLALAHLLMNELTTTYFPITVNGVKYATKTEYMSDYLGMSNGDISRYAVVASVIDDYDSKTGKVTFIDKLSFFESFKSFNAIHEIVAGFSTGRAGNRTTDIASLCAFIDTNHIDENTSVRTIHNLIVDNKQDKDSKQDKQDKDSKQDKQDKDKADKISMDKARMISALKALSDAIPSDVDNKTSLMHEAWKALHELMPNTFGATMPKSLK